MDHAIIACHEEEFAPFFASVWRCRFGWKPILLGLRGPGGLNPLLVLLFTLIGIWRFARVPQFLRDHQSEFVGQRITEIDWLLGSYGMGGPGFLGLRFASGWIVYRLWGATDWVTLDGKRIRDSMFPDELTQFEPYQLASLNFLIGAQFRCLECDDQQCDLVFERSASEIHLSFRRDGRDVPPHRGNGRTKVFATHERLEDAIVVSRVARLWLPD